MTRHIDHHLLGKPRITVFEGSGRRGKMQLWIGVDHLPNRQVLNEMVDCFTERRIQSVAESEEDVVDVGDESLGYRLEGSKEVGRSGVKVVH